MHALLYSQDPGGANILARVARRLLNAGAGRRVTNVVHPLAARVFNRLEVHAEPVSRYFASLPAASQEIAAWLRAEAVTHVICTTSSTQVDLTNGRLIGTARTAGIPTLSFLDHWVGFDRFVDEADAPRYLPDIVGCPDRFCQDKLLALGLPRGRAPIVGHAHLEAAAIEAPPVRARGDEAARVVLVSQPDAVGGTFRGAFFLPWGGVRVIDAAMAALEPLVRAGSVVVSYRPHPKEAGGDSLPASVQIDRDPDGAALLARHDVFVGVTSMVLFEAALAGRHAMQLDLPVLRESVSGEWPPYAAGTRIDSMEDLPGAVQAAAIRARAGTPGPGVDGLELAGSLDRSVAVAEAFLESTGGVSAWFKAASGAR